MRRFFVTSWLVDQCSYARVLYGLCICILGTFFFFSVVDFLPSDLSDKVLTVLQFASVSVVFDATVLSSLQALAPTSLDAQFVTCSHHLHCVV